VPGDAVTGPTDRAARRYQRLDAHHVRATLDRLQERIAARFPDRNLGRVAGELGDLVAQADDSAEVHRRRDSVVRTACHVAMVAVIGLAVVALGLSVRDALRSADGTPAFQWLPVIESAINDAVFAGIAAWFLHTIPARRQRGRTLAVLYRLRSIAHVIDMHQLTKDPERLRPDYPSTERSPALDLTVSELGRYLDYCTELLSIVGKAAALCAQASTDAVVLDTVSEIESLTLGMSRKIWQKIALVRVADGT